MKNNLFILFFTFLAFCCAGCHESDSEQLDSVVTEVLDFIGMEDRQMQAQASQRIRGWEPSLRRTDLNEYFFMVKEGIVFYAHDGTDSCRIQSPSIGNVLEALEAYDNKDGDYPYDAAIEQLAFLSDQLSKAQDPGIYPPALVWYYILFKRFADQALVRLSRQEVEEGFGGFTEFDPENDCFYLDLPTTSVFPAYKVAFYWDNKNRLMTSLIH